MPVDEIIWNPRTMDGGPDELYDPGEVIIEKGDTSIYSATPTIAELNAPNSKGFAQVWGYVKRRSITMAGLSPSFPIGANSRITANAMAIFQTDINTTRALEGFSSFTFDNSDMNQYLFIRRRHMIELRRALTLSGTCSLVRAPITSGAFIFVPGGASSLPIYRRFDDPLGTPTGATPEAFEKMDTGFPTDDIARKSIALAGSCIRKRAILRYRVPTFINLASSAAFTMSIAVSNGSGDVFTANIYTSNSYSGVLGNSPSLTPAFNGDFYRTDNLIASFPAPSAFAVQTQPVVLASLTPFAGSSVQIIIAHSLEVINGGTSSGHPADNIITNTTSETDKNIQFTF
jgi:hypothetical protein